ncbi:hypothetical protein EVAR_95325_1 [Eumeta japonica]|uniref:Uncharacterized protein n=1 Tax=Eumeta variegata TaxID=151549 RepID=A0A4C1U953_EUMVA|nr:hypothetical protein EVAR_95325_1 [Eumeta japonica]
MARRGVVCSRVVLLSMVMTSRSAIAVDAFCRSLRPAHDFDERAVLGLWYTREYIFHDSSGIEADTGRHCPAIQIRKLEDYINGRSTFSETFPTPPTPYPALTNSPYYNRAFASTTENHRTRSFVLEWHEGIWTEEYHFRVNPMYRGFWPTNIPDRSVDKMYRFLGGAIQVLKVSTNYLVLNFCMRLPYSKHFSVILSRNEHQLTGEDLAVIHNIFTTKRLPTSSLKRVCDNSADMNYSGVLTFIVLLISRWSFEAANASCRHEPRWRHKFKMEDSFGMWYAVEMAQHAPDLTDRPGRAGCLTLHVVDVGDEADRRDLLAPFVQDDTLQNSKYLYNRRRKSDAHPKRANEVPQKRRLLLLWDEEGLTLEQVYFYSDENPALWVAQQAEDEPWYPDAETRHEEIIYVLKITKSSLVLHHCMDNGRPLTLFFRRFPIPLRRWERAQFKNVLKSQNLDVYRESALCLTCRCSVVRPPPPESRRMRVSGYAEMAEVKRDVRGLKGERGNLMMELGGGLDRLDSIRLDQYFVVELYPRSGDGAERWMTECQGEHVSRDEGYECV